MALGRYMTLHDLFDLHIGIKVNRPEHHILIESRTCVHDFLAVDIQILSVGGNGDIFEMKGWMLLVSLISFTLNIPVRRPGGFHRASLWG